MKKLSIVFLSFFVLASCSNDKDDSATESGTKAITAFIFLATDNKALTKDVKATIDEEEKIITAEMPFGTDVTALQPTYTISESAEVSPENKVAQDFTKEVDYTVTAEDGSMVTYVAMVIIADPTDRQILVEFYNANPENALDWDLSNQDISAWEGVFSANSLEVDSLIIFENDIDVITPNFGKLSELLKLNLNGNKITKIPNEIGSLSKLKELYVYENQLSELPSSLWNLTSLEILGVGDNQLTELPSKVENLESLKFLDISNNNIGHLPDEIGGLANLEALVFFNGKLTSIPKSIGNLVLLERLVFAGNQITSLPPEIGNLTNLSNLHLSGNMLNALPSEIGNLRKLAVFWAQGNQLTSIPREMGNLTELFILLVQNNQITVIPQEVCDLNIQVFQKDDAAFCEEDLE